MSGCDPVPETAPAPRVSVLMPVYNGAAFLEASVMSVLAQGLKDFELLVVDDGSTDGTPQLLAHLSATDPRIRVIRQANGGISRALNAGLEAARGTWVARLDADDLMLPCRLERQLAFVEANPDVAAAGSYYEIIDAAGSIRGLLQPLPRTRQELARLLASREPLTFTHPTMIYRRAAALDAGGYVSAFEPCEDVALFARMLAAGGTILIQPEVLTRYRVHAGSISSRKAVEQFTMRHFIYHNFHAARDGAPTFTYEGYLAWRRAWPLGRRLRLQMGLASEILYRRYTTARVEGRAGRALACLALASAFRPYKALRRGLRGLTGRILEPSV